MALSVIKLAFLIACVAGGIVRVRRKILTVESEYGRRSREEYGKDPLWNLAAWPLASRGFAARIGGSAAIASRWSRQRDNIPPAMQAAFLKAMHRLTILCLCGGLCYKWLFRWSN